MNKVILIGNLTKEPERVETKNGTAVTKFTIAVNRPTADRDADFINIVAWRDLAENCYKYLSKGKKVCVEGSMQTRSYEAQDGTNRYVTEVIAREVEFLSPRSEEPAEEPQQEARRKPLTQGAKQIVEDGDLPF